MEDVESKPSWVERLGFVLHEGEAKLLGKLIRLLEARGPAGREGLDALKEALERVARLWDAIDAFPSVYAAQTLGRRYRNFDTLVETFSHINRYVTEAYLPTRAVLGRGYAMAKFNYCRLMGVVVEEFLADGPEADDLEAEVEEVMRDSACTLIAEDLLMSIVSDDRLEDELRRRAASVLGGLWENRDVAAIQDFFKVLASIWRAKASVTINYGTLAGITELFCLARAGCDPEFLSFFCRDDVGEDERAALLEFMFNATYEELEIMRRYMREHGVKVLEPEDVAKIFDVPLNRLHRTTHTAEDIFFTFRERQTMASHRLVRNLPGPKKTAEEYVMIYLLRKQIAKEQSQGGESEEDDSPLPPGWNLTPSQDQHAVH